MDYKNSKIYTIRSPQTDKYYIGATTQPLSKRFWTHKNMLNCSSREIIGLGDAYIELLEEFSCDTKEQLSKREGELQRDHKASIVNVRLEGRTRQEYSTTDIFKKCVNKYQSKPEIKEIMKENAKQYAINNREKINAKNRERRRLAKENLA